jgi:serine/threonine-protein kinase
MGDDKGLLEPGTLLDNRYEVVNKLGEGGMATIYLVRHLGLRSLHALKVPDPRLFQSPEARQRFTNEGRIQALLRHPHIAQVTDIVISPVPGLVMEYVEGGTLGELCEQSPGGRLDLGVLRELFPPVLGAMEEAHGHRVVHRDLTPGNILLSKGHQGRMHPKVTDFGIAKVEEEESQRYRTRTGVLLGTRPYMSPEQIRGAAEVDARTDIFALGAILYEAVTGRVAFDADSDFEMMTRISEGRYTPPEQVVPGLPEGLVQCIRKALAVDPAERFQDCAAFRTALVRALEVRPQPEPPPPVVPEPSPKEPVVPPPAAPAPRKSFSRGLLLLGGLSGGLGLALLVSVGLLFLGRSETRDLRARYKAETKVNQQLRQERDEALRQRDVASSQAGSSAAQAQDLQQRAQDALKQLQERDRLTVELQDLQKNILKSMELTFLEITTRNGLDVERVVRTCNKTDTVLSYQVLEESGDWGETMVLEPEECRPYHLKGYHPRVPVRYSGALTGNVYTPGEALASMVVGRQPDLDSDWRPWENQLVLGQDDTLQLRTVHVGQGTWPLGSQVK